MREQRFAECSARSAPRHYTIPANWADALIPPEAGPHDYGRAHSTSMAGQLREEKTHNVRRRSATPSCCVTKDMQQSCLAAKIAAEYPIGDASLQELFRVVTNVQLAGTMVRK